MKIPGVPVSRRLLNSSIIIAFFSAGILFSQEPPVPPPAKGKAKDNKLEQKAAGQNAQKADAPKIKDYSAGFEKFYKLGLPDVSNAKYVKLDVYSNYGPSSMLSYQLRAMGIKGNAWQLKEDKAGKNVFIVDQCRTVELYDYEVLSKIRTKEMEEKQKNEKDSKKPVRIEFNFNDDGRNAGKWEDADLKQDLAKILEFLNKKNEDAEGNNRHSYDQLSMEGGYGILLLTAIHAYKKGFKDEANQIAGKLFERANEPQKVIGQAMTIVADSRYNEIMDSFFASGDWNALSKDLDALLATFSSGWRNAGAVKMLAANVKKRAAMTAPPELSDPKLTDEDKKLAVEIANADNSKVGQMIYRRDLWVLPKGKGNRQPSQESLNSRITARGMKSVPLLLALLKDDYLTRIDTVRLKGSSYISNYFNNKSPEDIANEIYQQMRRPATRADFAYSVIQPVVVSDRNEYELRKEGPEAMYDACSEWYEANKDKSPKELAKAYLTDDNSSHKSEAMSFLIKNGNEEDYKTLEKMFLEGEATEHSNVQLAMMYAQKRGEKAKDFVEKMIKKIEEIKPEDDADQGNKDYMKRWTAETIKNLKDSISTTTAQDVVNDILSGKAKIDESTMLLMKKLARMNKEDAEKMMLNAALQAKDTQMSLRFISFANPGMYNRYDDFGDEEEEDVDVVGDAAVASEKEKKEEAPQNIELWKKLLADSRTVEGPGADGKFTVGDAVAMQLDSRLRSISGNNRYKCLASLGYERVMPIIKERALKILEGKPEGELPAYPDSGNIPEEKRQKLIADLKASPEPEKAIAKLSSDELMAVIEESDKKPEETAGFFNASCRIGKVDSDLTGNAKIEEMKSAEGKVLDKALLEKMLAVSRELAANGVDMTALVMRKPCLGGVTISFKKVDPKNYVATQFGREKGTEAFVSGICSIQGSKRGYSSATWPLTQPEKKVKDKKKTDDLLEEALEEAEADTKDMVVQRQTEFWKSIDEFCAGKGNSLRNAVIMFSAVAEKKPQPEPEKKADPANPVQVIPEKK